MKSAGVLAGRENAVGLDEIDRAVVEGLVKRGIKVLAMRCAGYNNVDFKAAYEAGLTVVRVPAYSP